jgi:molybdenum cofactor cytidylyltransferase
MKIGLAVLAAGSSTRLGRPKQTLVVGGVPLLTKVCRTALESGADRTIVVVGGNEEQSRQVIPAGLDIIENPDHATGLSASIRKAVEALAECSAIVIVLGDQPNVPSSHLLWLMDQMRADLPVAVSKYPDGNFGVPAAFASTLFPKLMALEGDRGAKQLLVDLKGELIVRDLADGRDIDTDNDLVCLDE